MQDRFACCWLRLSAVNKLDWTVIRTAATAGLLVIVPGAFLTSVVFRDGPAALSWLFLGLILAGLGLAGYVAGRLRSDTPILHGIVSALLCFLVAQAFGIVLTLARSESITWVAIPLTALLAGFFGAAGALLSDVVHRRTVRANANAG